MPWRRGGAWRVLMSAFRRLDADALKPLASALFIPSGPPALLVWAALLTHPRLAIGALVGLAAGHILKAKLLPSIESGVGGGVVTNALLAAVACMWLTREAQLPVVTELLVALATASTAGVMAAAFERMFQDSELPPLGLGYVVVVGILFIVFPLWAQQAVTSTDWGPRPTSFLLFLAAFARALGSLFFMPDPVAGALIALAVLMWSRLAFLFGLVGWLGGMLASMAFIGLGERFFWLPPSYAFFLAGLALSSSFFVASRAGLTVAVVAGFFAALLALVFQFALAWSPAAFLPLHLILTLWIGILALRADRFAPLLVWNRRRHQSPERSWVLSELEGARWPRGQPILTVPLDVPVQITQGFDSPPSHRAEWRYAVDFQLPLAHGKAETERPSLWDAPVYSPVPGIVEAIRNDVPDNPLGIVNYHERWGNHVIVRMSPSAFVTVAHLKQGSVAITPGSKVEYGTYLGRVGNSGRSPIPHLHLQVQTKADLVSSTRPFVLANCVTSEAFGLPFRSWHSALRPLRGQVVAQALRNDLAYEVLTGILAGRAFWSITHTGTVPRRWTRQTTRSGIAIERSVREDGSIAYIDEASGARITVVLFPDALRVVDYEGSLSPMLVCLALGMSTIPYAVWPGTEWTDTTAVPSMWVTRHIPHLACLFTVSPLLTTHMECRSADDAQGLAITSAVRDPAPNLPEHVFLTHSRLKGPSAIRALFPGGETMFELVSFQAGSRERPGCP